MEDGPLANTLSVKHIKAVDIICELVKPDHEYTEYSHKRKTLVEMALEGRNERSH